LLILNGSCSNWVSRVRNSSMRVDPTFPGGMLLRRNKYERSPLLTLMKFLRVRFISGNHWYEIPIFWRLMIGDHLSCYQVKVGFDSRAKSNITNEFSLRRRKSLNCNKWLSVIITFISWFYLIRSSRISCCYAARTGKVG